MNAPAALPSPLQARLDRLVSELVPLVPARVVALALYGGPAKGKAMTASSDVNLLIVVADSSSETLKAVAKLVLSELTRAS